MAFKLLSAILVILAVQGAMSKSVKPFWGSQSLIDPTMDPELVAILSGIQMSLSRLSYLTKATIGQRVGLASKQVGSQMSGAKTALKLAVNNLDTLPNITKECRDANELQVDQIRTDAKNQMSMCSKTAQLQLKSMNQVQKDMSLQISALSSETTTMVSQCKLQNPLPTDNAAVSECCKLGSEAIMEKITALETNLMNTVTAVDAAVKQIVDTGDECIKNTQTDSVEQLNNIGSQMQECSATTPLA